jgi:hypothetical protein
LQSRKTVTTRQTKERRFEASVRRSISLFLGVIDRSSMK